MGSENKSDSPEDERKSESSKPRWWNQLWIIIAIFMVGGGVISYFLLYIDFVRIIIFEIIISVVLGIAYYIHLKPSSNVNKLVYVLLGITPIGLGLWFLYAILCGLTNFCNLLNNFQPVGYWLNFTFQIGLFVIGGFIGNWIGKKRKYFLPLIYKKTLI